MILLVAKNGKPVVVHLNTDALAALNILRSRGDGSGLVVRNAAGEALNAKRALVHSSCARRKDSKLPPARRPPHVRVALVKRVFQSKTSRNCSGIPEGRASP